MGLSPRVRGNLIGRRPNIWRYGSIPARAGEPPSGEATATGPKVYPRACGGTPFHIVTRFLKPGLSPRVRGNRRDDTRAGKRRGSIPARAGEPIRFAPLSRCRGVYPRACGEPGVTRRAAAIFAVYPRACGGTIARRASQVHSDGLSPRVRGNPSSTLWRAPPARSIPARAGEPFPTHEIHPALRVYPRACGGTQTTIAKGLLGRGLSPRVRGNPPSCPQ